MTYADCSFSADVRRRFVHFRRNDDNEFKAVVKVANQLRMDHLFAQEINVVSFDHKDNEQQIAGALVR